MTTMCDHCDPPHRDHGLEPCDAAMVDIDGTPYVCGCCVCPTCGGVGEWDSYGHQGLPQVPATCETCGGLGHL